MTDKARGSDQLKLDCASFSTLTEEELIQVAGGYIHIPLFPRFPVPQIPISLFPLPFPEGIPRPDLFIPRF